MKKIHLHKGDITKLYVDAIVNAANNSLLGGGGVDGAIHNAAGEKLLEECETLNGCETGNAKITKGYDLSAKYIIHAVGPVFSGGRNDDNAILESTYRKSLEIAAQKNLKSIAFPCISTGIYGFPKEKASEIAINTVKQFLNDNPTIENVTFVTFDEANYQIYREKLNKI